MHIIRSHIIAPPNSIGILDRQTMQWNYLTTIKSPLFYKTGIPNAFKNFASFRNILLE